MNPTWISQFIDDELDLDEKEQFVRAVQASREYAAEALALLEQEKWLRAGPREAAPPEIRFAEPFGFRLRRWMAPLAAFAAGAAVAAVLWVFLIPVSGGQALRPHRFVLYRPEAARVEITGSFTGWRSLPMRRTGGAGYWEITLDLPAGEHRFSYIVEGGKPLADPTVAQREQDDFGGENSILEVTFSS